MSHATLALALDMRLIALFVDRWREEGQEPLGLNYLAWHLDGRAAMSEGKVAILMKAAEQEGWVHRTSPRGDQGEWVPSLKAVGQFPDGESQVMPDEHAGGGWTGVSGEEARTWEGETPLPMPARPKELGA